jgi:hypothetical protein
MPLGILVVLISLAAAPQPGVLVADAAASVQAQPPPSADETARAEEELYEQGTQALDEAAWDRAASIFARLSEQEGRRADGALYWLAYARSKQGRGPEALRVLDELRLSYPQSRWVKEAEALELEVRQQAGQPVRPESVADEDLKLMALNGLLHSAPDEAIPMLEKFLKGKQSPKLQERALFVLCQSGSPRAREIVLGIARGESQPQLRRKAIQSLGIFGGRESRKALADIYAASDDASVKKAVLQAFMTAGEKDRVLEAARTEPDPDLRQDAIRLLGAMGARDELWALYSAETAGGTKQAALQGLGIAGAQDRLLEVAKTEKDLDLRVTAIRFLGVFGGPARSDVLLEIYRDGGAPRVREAVLGALFVQGNASALVTIARTEKDPALKKQAVSQLALMPSDEAKAYLLEILGQ